jgi:hypothetical protein
VLSADTPDRDTRVPVTVTVTPPAG